jgi:hypothetical protein
LSREGNDVSFWTFLRYAVIEIPPAFGLSPTPKDALGGQQHQAGADAETWRVPCRSSAMPGLRKLRASSALLRRNFKSIAEAR